MASKGGKKEKRTRQGQVGSRSNSNKFGFPGKCGLITDVCHKIYSRALSVARLGITQLVAHTLSHILSGRQGLISNKPFQQIILLIKES